MKNKELIEKLLKLAPEALVIYNVGGSDYYEATSPHFSTRYESHPYGLYKRNGKDDNKPVIVL